MQSTNTSSDTATLNAEAVAISDTIDSGEFTYL